MASERSVVVRIRAEIGDFRRQMDQAATATTAMGRAAGEAGQTTSEALTEARASARDIRAALNDAGKAAQEAAQGFGLSYNSAGQLTDQFGNMVTEAHAAELGLETASEATREFAAQTAHASAEAGQATTHMGRLAASAREHEEAWSTAGGTLLGFGAAVVAGVGLAIAKYAEFDKAMSEVQAATHETAGNMALMREAAIAAGADTAFSAKEAADAISELSKAGVTVKDILAGGLSGALSLAAAGSLGVADAAELAATAMTQFGLEGGDIPHIADLLAAGAGKAQGSVEDIGNALKQGGLVAAQFGLSIEDTTGTLAAFASAGLVGSDSGTSLKTMLLKLASPSKEAKGMMDDLGIAAYDAGGKFVGVASLAGQLKDKLADSTDGTKKMTQATRDNTLATIFGTDAIRGANVLYEQGADGIAKWTDAVNESGFAASTAAIKQDNLTGDLEKLGGSFDTVLIQGGGGAATALRGLVQGAEDLVDGLGKVSPQFLGLATSMAGTVGVAALLGGGFLALLPKVLAAHAAFKLLQTSNAPLAGGLTKVGKAAGIAMVALLALSAVGAIFSDKHILSAEQYANAIMKVSSAGKNAQSSDLNSVFQDFDKFGGRAVSDIDNVGDAIKKLTHQDFNDVANKFVEPLTTAFGFPKQEIGQLEDRLKGLGETLGDVASSGGAASAAKTFSLLTDEFKKNGKGAQDALDMMPGYKNALLKLGNAAGVALEPNELLELAVGRIPPRMEAAQKSTEGQAKAAEYQAKMSEEAAKQLDEMGLAADGTVLSLSKLLDVMFASGLIQLSANEAAIKYQESLENMDATFKKYGNNLDITTEGGKANKRAIDGMASAGIANMQAMADNGATQEELQGKLKGTYDSLIGVLGQFGITGTAADDMARQVLGIPKDVPIETSIQNFADTMAKAQAIKGAVDGITGKSVDVIINHINRQVAGGGSPEDPSMTALDPGSLSRRDGGLIGFATGGQYKGYAGAGYVRGPGTGTSDEVNARLSNGEYVIRASKVAQYGTKTFDAYNNGYAAPSKSMAGGYGQTQSFSGFAAGGSSASGGASVTFSPQITVTGVTDTGAVVQEIWGKFQFEAQKAGLRIGG